jgi:polyferredoxin
LRSLWQPQGLQKIVDEMLHTVIPIAYVAYWFFYTNKQTITWKNCFRWLIYPLVYLIVILVVGSFSKYYPYPFVDVIVLGFEKVLFNSILLTLFFVFVSLLFVGVAKLKTRKENKERSII